MNIIDAIKKPSSWRIHRNSGVYHYYENTVSGERKAVKFNLKCFQPVDWDWLGRSGWVEDDGRIIRGG